MRHLFLIHRVSIVALVILGSILCMVATGTEKPLEFSDRNESGYQPNTTYAGEFIPAKLYYRNPRSVFWMQTNNSDNYKELVTCPVALSSLEYTGSWQGHLQQDGSCGAQEEPAYFALGNRINYDVLLDQDVSSK